MAVVAPSEDDRSTTTRLRQEDFPAGRPSRLAISSSMLLKTLSDELSAAGSGAFSAVGAGTTGAASGALGGAGGTTATTGAERGADIAGRGAAVDAGRFNAASRRDAMSARFWSALAEAAGANAGLAAR